MILNYKILWNKIFIGTEMADLKQSELRTTNIIPFVFTASIEGDIKIIKITSTT